MLLYAIGGVVALVIAYSVYYRVRYGKTAAQSALTTLEARVAQLEADLKAKIP